MRFNDLAKLSTRMFRTRPSRTWLTILGMGVGIGAVLFLVALGYGLQDTLLSRIVRDEALLSLSVASPSNEQIVLDQKTLDEFSSIPRVKDVGAVASFPAQIKYSGLTGSVVLRAAPSSYFAYAGISPISGKLFRADSLHEIVVSQAVLKILDVERADDIIGKSVMLDIIVPARENTSLDTGVITMPVSYVVTGIVEGLESPFIYFPLNELVAQTPVDIYEQARVRVEKDTDLEPIREQIISRGFQVTSLADTIDQTNKIFHIIQVILGLFGAIALVVSAIGMFNTMTVTLLERTHEIGVMRAIGASKRDILALFLGESTIMGVAGGLMGILIGFLGGEISNSFINALARRFGGQSANLFLYPSWFLVSIVLFSAAIGFLTGVIPARRAAKLNPLDALRYK